MSGIKQWIEAMRLRTLPAGLSGVIAGTACAVEAGGFKVAPAVLCLIFALLAQIASNFANEYYDYANGLDKPGREGFRRGVTEGDISPRAMKVATYLTLAMACVIGLVLMLCFGSWWMLIVGVLIALAALAYSTGPWPLSHHGLGDVTVILFYGVVPVILTCYLQTQSPDALRVALFMGLSVGLLSANILIVNNYRDADDDALVGKRTLVVILGRNVMSGVYLVFGLGGILLSIPFWQHLGISVHQCPASGAAALGIVPIAIMCVFAALVIALWRAIKLRRGSALNPLLGKTALLLLLFTLATLFTAFFASI